MPSRKRFVEIIGVPVDLGAGRRGVDGRMSAAPARAPEWRPAWV